jgi:hypothetical protein
MANVAINRETGEILVVGEDGQWKPAQRARNPQTGEEIFNDGTQWKPIPAAPQPQRTAAEGLARGAGLGLRTFGDIGAGMLAGAAMGAPLGGVGAIPGAIAGGVAAGLARPVSDLAVSAWNAATGGSQRTPSQAYEELMTRAGVPQPEGAMERMTSTAARAGVETMLGARQARAIADALPVSSQFGRPVAETLAAGPGAQTAAATTAGGVTQGLLEGGVPAPLAVLGGMATPMLPTIRPQNIFPARNPGPRVENLEALRQAGVPLTPAQELGNPAASVFESVMRYLPTSAPTVARAEDATLRGWTRAVNRQFGLDSDIATPEVLTAYQRQWGQKADALEAATRLRPDKTFADDVSNMRSQYTRGLTDAGLYGSFDSQLRRVEDFITAKAQGAEMPGANYRVIDGELRFAADSAKRSDNPAIQEYGRAMARLRESFQGLMERSAAQTPTQAAGAPGGAQARGPGNQPLLPGQAQLPAPEGRALQTTGGANLPSTQMAGSAGQQAGGSNLAQAWKDLNRDYALFSRVREAMGSATGKDKLNTGFIPPSALAQTERASLGPEAYGMAQDPFTRLVRAGEAIIPNPTPNSGTAQRSFAQNVLTGARTSGTTTAGLGAGAGGAAAAGLVDPVVSATLGLGLPYVSSKLWFGRPIPPERQGLLGLQALMGAADAEQYR